MSRYNRITRECSLSQLHPALSQAIREYFQTHQFGDADTETCSCCETISEKRNTGRLASILDGDRDTIYHLAILMTQDMLIWARSGDRSGTVVTWAKFKAIRVRVFVSGRSKNIKLEISGFMADSKEYVRGSLELGSEMAAQRFCEKVEKTVLRENPPAERKFPRWMGG